MRPARAAALALVAGVLVAGCGAPPGGAADPAASGAGVVSGTVTVFAAASLTEAFTQLGAGFEADHPGVGVVFSFAGSSALAAQIVEGAPADAYASASPETMATVVEAGEAATEPQVFARNRLVIAVAAGNPLGIRGLADLADPAHKVAICARQVPCGALAEQALAGAGVALTPATLERDVKAALSKVTLGEVDAALVYRTDIAAVDTVDGVPLARPVRNDYAAVSLAGAGSPGTARAFVDYLGSAEAASALRGAGFEVP